MKKLLLTGYFAIALIAVYGQGLVPNGDFENWTSASWDMPDNYPNTSNADVYFNYGLPFNLTQSGDAYHGTYAVQLTTVASASDTVFGYFVNASPDGNPETWTGGIPYDQMPSGMRGWYKYNVDMADSATILVAFSKTGTNIGTYYIKLGGVKDTYTLFEYTFDPALSETPDSVVLGVVSCKFSKGQDEPHGPAGSTLLLDSISFTGVSMQPDLLNGDFESWTNMSSDHPDNWYVLTEQGQGFGRSTDAAKGDYALELTSYIGNQNGHMVTRPSYASSGYYPDNCNDDCQQMGGFPFTEQADTLVFSYQYAPADPKDTAFISLTLKKDGNWIWGGGLPLPAAAGYVQMELPFMTEEAPDTANLDILSGNWQDTTLAFAGAKLLVDDIHFKSEEMVPTGIPGTGEKNAWKVYPNPTQGLVRIEGLGTGTRSVEVADVSGKIVYSYTHGLKPAPDRIDLSPYGRGVYFITIDDGKGSRTEKVVVK